MQWVLFLPYEVMSKKERKPEYVPEQEIMSNVELENVKPIVRFLWEVTNTQESWLRANVWDLCYNTSLSVLRVRRKSGRTTV